MFCVLPQKISEPPSCLTLFNSRGVSGAVMCSSLLSLQMTGEVGSYRYMAPELVKHKPYNAKADIYSWAIMSWEILAVSRPYAGMNEMEFAKVCVWIASLCLRA